MQVRNEATCILELRARRDSRPASKVLEKIIEGNSLLLDADVFQKAAFESKTLVRSKMRWLR